MSHTNQALQPHKMARGLKFQSQKVEGLYYLCSENKGAYQLRGNREADLRRGNRGADLRLCFRICKKPVFSPTLTYITASERNMSEAQITAIAIFCGSLIFQTRFLHALSS